ncbi:hypothetical protein Nhal_2536 [Nitrosococcus halophilus Nc 4]|uniref:Uncharacterized protein n=1 Tax=Nitrosococcus halophilus (strain Nc4) TaxID=472759 RepID=D5BWF9_NITHN|nr:hypothetical protein [Nitrosococcus halophilus]ADE15616.1 hypothetical protein Nhal_2536 [Nitrosococcus halophilus Nc 4]
MAADHRLQDDAGNRIPYSCGNRRYRTNIEKGCRHGEFSETLGSVFEEPLIDNGGWTLWLEHATEIETEAEVYWFMWYAPDGIPTIPLSGIFDRADLARMNSMLAQFVP